MSSSKPTLSLQLKSGIWRDASIERRLILSVMRAADNKPWTPRAAALPLRMRSAALRSKQLFGQESCQNVSGLSSSPCLASSSVIRSVYRPIPGCTCNSFADDGSLQLCSRSSNMLHTVSFAACAIKIKAQHAPCTFTLHTSG
jgi:hypothetical protein